MQYQWAVRDASLEYGSRPQTDFAPATTADVPTKAEQFRADAYSRMFINKHDVDMRQRPMVQHPVTGVWHFDHGFWPIDRQ